MDRLTYPAPPAEALLGRLDERAVESLWEDAEGFHAVLGPGAADAVAAAEAPIARRPARPEELSGRWVVTALGDAERVAALLAAEGSPPLAARSFPGGVAYTIVPPPGRVSTADLRAALLDRQQGDLAVQRDRVARRRPRFVFFDMDSTLLACEVIDELARLRGVHERVAAVTARAMAGELDYEASLRARVAELEGLAYAEVQALAPRLPMMDGAEEAVRTLKGLGAKTAVLSGGFHVAADVLAARLGLEHAHANRLEVEGGKLTGRVAGRVVTPQRKASLLRELSSAAGVPQARTVAVGDGANDLLMLGASGLGVAFHAKPKVRAAADTSIATGPLTLLLELFR